MDGSSQERNSTKFSEVEYGSFSLCPGFQTNGTAGMGPDPNWVGYNLRTVHTD